MIPGEPQPLRVLYVGPEQAGCHGKKQVAGQRDGLVGDELRYRELDDALGLTALAGDVLADARTGKNGRMLWQSVFGRLAADDPAAPGPRGFAKPDGPLVLIK